MGRKKNNEVSDEMAEILGNNAVEMEEEPNEDTFSNDEIEKEIRCCITKGEQTLFAQISCNNLIIMLIIGLTLIFVLALC